jgi:hypothetical protein
LHASRYNTTPELEKGRETMRVEDVAKKAYHDDDDDDDR